MSAPERHSLPREADRDDGLQKVRCPYCNWVWYRVQPAKTNVLHEIKCRQCKRIVLYRVDGCYVEDLSATQMEPQ